MDLFGWIFGWICRKNRDTENLDRAWFNVYYRAEKLHEEVDDYRRELEFKTIEKAQLISQVNDAQEIIKDLRNQLRLTDQTVASQEKKLESWAEQFEELSDRQDQSDIDLTELRQARTIAEGVHTEHRRRLEQKYYDAVDQADQRARLAAQEARDGVRERNTNTDLCPFCGEGSTAIEADGQVCCLTCGGKGPSCAITTDPCGERTRKWKVRVIQ